jgi:hypothetical protein
MIFLLSNKQWEKHKKKLVEPKNYLILDATDDSDAKMASFTNMVTMDNFAVPLKLLRWAGDDDFDDEIDLDRIEDLETSFFKSDKFAVSVIATMSAFLESDINVFIVVRNKAYKFYRNKFKSEFCKVFPDAANCLVIMKNDIKKHKKDLNYSFSSEEVNIMKKALRKKEKQMQEITTKAKKKSKKKIKDGWGWKA